MKRSSGYSTEKRTQILEYLVEHKDEDVSVKDIEKYLTTKELSVNVTTIYRYLDKLCGEGTVMKRIDEKSGKSTYEYAKPHHTCRNSRKNQIDNCRGTNSGKTHP